MSTVLRVSNLSKEFGGLRAVDDFSLEVAAGEFIGLIGPNGCGKTTTFNCISGLLEATGGEVEIFGQPAGRLRPDQIQQLGLTRTFQHTRLWREMTAIENLLIPPRNQFGITLAPDYGICGMLALLNALLAQSVLVEHLAYLTALAAFGMGFDPLRALLMPWRREEERARVRRAYEVLDQLQIRHMAHNLTSELSGGQSKLVDIGRALMGEPQLLLLDEPVAGVAGPLADKIFNDLHRIVNETGISVVVIEHNMDFILRQGVDRIVVMDRGRVLMEGTPNEVKASSEVIEAYLGGRAGGAG